MTPFLRSIAALDEALTGKPLHEVLHTARNQEHLFSTPEMMYLGEIYYLSDGGYSRLAYHIDSSTIELADALEKVDRKWPGAIAERRAVEQKIAAWRREVGA